ncbi:MAG: hypothetical protein DME05_22555 [Candidatus Rokuibacteriota bacterium]|nr:MAG: hypothetical protein DME05_22555 [Candidatus Rokubacteria bacterium]
MTVTLTAVSERLGDHALTIESFRAGSIGLGTFSTTYVVIANGGRWLVDSISVSGEAGYGANDGQPHSLAFKVGVAAEAAEEAEVVEVVEVVEVHLPTLQT